MNKPNGPPTRESSLKVQRAPRDSRIPEQKTAPDPYLFPEQIEVSAYLNRRTLILGEVNTGKTTLTGRIMAEILKTAPGSGLAVVDLAPQVPDDLAGRLGLKGVGGRLVPPAKSGCLYLTTTVVPPRLSSKTEDQAEQAAEENRQRIETLFETFAASGRTILFINDLSLYLQAGRASRLAGWMEKASTVVANGYFGEKLGGGRLSRRERGEMEALIILCDSVIRL